MQEWDRQLSATGRVEFEVATWWCVLTLSLGIGAALSGLFIALAATPADRALMTGIGGGDVALGILLVWWVLRRRSGPAVIVTAEGVRDVRRRHVVSWSGIRVVDVVEAGRLGVPLVLLLLNRDEYAALVARDRWPRRLLAPSDVFLAGRTLRLLPLRGVSAEEVAGWLDRVRRASWSRRHRADRPLL